jgi:hypothetical protein
MEAAELLGVHAVIKFNAADVKPEMCVPPGLSVYEINFSYFETLSLRLALGEQLEGAKIPLPPVHPMRFHGGNCGPIGG